MKISDLYNSIGKGVGKITSGLGDFFNGRTTYKAAPKAVAPKGIDPNNIGYHIMKLESDRGTHPNTAPDVPRTFTIPAANANEEDRVVPYQVGYGGYAGITPDALGQFHKSEFDRNAPAASTTSAGLPLIPGRDVNRTLKLLETEEGVNTLTGEMFNSFRKDPNAMDPETLTNDYMDYWVRRGGINYTPENRARVLKYFQSLLNNQ